MVKCYPALSMVKCNNCNVGMSSHGPEHEKQTESGIIWREDLAQKWNSRNDKAAKALEFAKSLQLSVADEMKLNEIIGGEL